MNRLCIYHSEDLDGQCSAAIVRRQYPDVDLDGWNYGNPIPWRRIEEAGEVILVDVSFQRDEMERLFQKGKVVWIDHHKTAIEAMRELAELGVIRGIRRNGTAACELTWEYYFLEPMPHAVWLLGRWDVWAWPDLADRDEIEAFQFGMRAEDTRPENDRLWGELLDHDSLVESIVAKGRAIIAYRDQQNARLARSAFETIIDGHRVLALNAGGGSTTFDSVWSDHPECVAMCSFVYTGRQWRVSLYSDRGLDCSSVAKAHGGGGHAGAAGFQCSELPFRLGG